MDESQDGDLLGVDPSVDGHGPAVDKGGGLGPIEPDGLEDVPVGGLLEVDGFAADAGDGHLDLHGQRVYRRGLEPVVAPPAIGRLLAGRTAAVGMSDAATEADPPAGSDIWIERYRPSRLDDIRGHEAIVERLKRYVAEDDLPNLLFAGPAGVGKTTAAVAIARELYGDDWREHFLELNASDDRGIDVVRGRIKDFARSSFGGHDYRIVFLDEADSLTDDAQSALRRTMEQFSGQTRFILSCNYSSRIIDPIQSRCAVFRFQSLADEAVGATIDEIAATEGIDVDDSGRAALIYVADGDMRRAINALQAAAVLGGTVDDDRVYEITATARPEVVEEMIAAAAAGEFLRARGILDELVTDMAIAADDIVDQIHRGVWDLDLEEDRAVALLEHLGEVDYRISVGANETLQLEALLATLARGNAAD